MKHNITAETFETILNNLPLAITYIDENDIVRYYTKGQKEIFVRTPEAIGRNVRDCHPKKSLDRVNELINELKSGERDSAEFWVNHKGRKIYLTYVPLRDAAGKYLGMLEVIQDITELRKITGIKPLIQDSWSTRFS